MSLKDIAGPIIQGVFGIGGAAVGAHSQNKANDASLQANREAIAFQREQEATRKAEYEKSLAIYDQNRRALLSRYGIDIASFAAPAAGATTGTMAGPAAGGAAAPATLSARGPVAPGRPGNLRDIIAAGSPEDVQGWSDWKRYGLA